MPFHALQAAAVLASELWMLLKLSHLTDFLAEPHEGLTWVQVMHSELPCDQEAPPCGATCGKLLLCGQHHCQERCHTGPCPATCRLLVDKSCACGLTQRRMPCSQPLRRAACACAARTLAILEGTATLAKGALHADWRPSYHEMTVTLWLGRPTCPAQPSMRGERDLRRARM